MKYMQGPPRFPLLVDSGTRLYCLTGDKKTDIDLQHEIFQGKNLYPAIDSSATAYGYIPEADILSFYPLPELKTKKNLIELYNARRKDGAELYQPASLSNKRFGTIVKEIAELVLKQSKLRPSV